MRRKSVALVMAAATVLSLMAGSGVTALADEETVELTMWGGGQETRSDSWRNSWKALTIPRIRFTLLTWHRIPWSRSS